MSNATYIQAYTPLPPHIVLHVPGYTLKENAVACSSKQRSLEEAHGDKSSCIYYIAYIPFIAYIILICMVGDDEEAPGPSLHDLFIRK